MEREIYGCKTNNEIYVTFKKVDLLEENSYEKALNLLNELIKKYPNNFECYIKKANLLEDYYESIKNYTKAIELAKSPIAYYFRGQTYIRIGNFDNAIDDFTTIIEMPSLKDRDYILNSSYSFRIIAYCASGDWINAKKDIKLLSDEFITYLESFQGPINKERLVKCINNKELLN